MDYIVRMVVSGEVDVTVTADSAEEAIEEAYATAPGAYLDRLEDVETDVLSVDEYDGATEGFDFDEDDDQLDD